MRSALRSRWVKIGIPVAAIAATFVGAAPASAATAPVTVSATSAYSTTLQKSISVSCPAGRSAVGVTASTTRPWAVHITGLVPNGSLATATARVFSGVGYSWRITVTAVCAVTPAGLQYVSITSTTPVSPGSPVVGATATCPSAKRLIGLGGSVSGGRILSFMPQSSPANGIWLSGQPFPGTAGPLTVRSVAVCATAGFASRYDEPPLTESQGQPVVSAANCPAGMYVHAAAGWAANDTAYISTVAVNGAKTGASLTLRSSAGSPFSGKVIPFCVG